MTLNKSQSLFLWNKPCNRDWKNLKITTRCHNPYFYGINLAIEVWEKDPTTNNSHNPYFYGINLAISKMTVEYPETNKSQSLFLWNKPCNILKKLDTLMR